jgi:hypothetical protein
MIAASARGSHISTDRRSSAVSGAGGKLEKPIMYVRALALGALRVESAHAPAIVNAESIASATAGPLPAHAIARRS